MIVKTSIKREKVLETILVIVAGFLAISILFSIKTLMYIALVLLGVTILSVQLSEKIALFWLRLANILGKINSFLLLSAIFYLLLTPWAFIYRLFNKDILKIKAKQEESYYFERNHEYSAQDFENMW